MIGYDKGGEGRIREEMSRNERRGEDERGDKRSCIYSRGKKTRREKKT